MPELCVQEEYLLGPKLLYTPRSFKEANCLFVFLALQPTVVVFFAAR